MSFPPPTKQQARVLWFALTAMAMAVVLVLIGLLLWGVGWMLHELSAVLVPMAFALILAYILSPVVDYLVKKRMSRVWAVCVVFASVGIVTLTLIGSVLPDLKDETSRLIHDLPNNVESVKTKVKNFAETSKLGHELPASWRRALVGANAEPGATNAPTSPSAASTNAGTNGIVLNLNVTVASPTNDANSHLTNGISTADTKELNPGVDQQFSGSVLPAVSRGLLWIAEWFTDQLKKLSTWVEFLIGFILVPVYLFYFLLEEDSITRHWTDYLPLKESPAKKELIFVLRAINDCMIVFFRGQVLVALCVGVLLTIGYLLMGLNYAVLLGVVAGVLGIVPYLGTITTLILALTVAGIQFGDWTHPMIVLGIAAVVKLLEDFIISPKIIGERAGLHPLTIIIAVLVGTTLLGGFIGALLAIPLTAALRTLMHRYIWNRGHLSHSAEHEKTQTVTKE